MSKNKSIWDVICHNKTLNPEFIILSDSEGSYTWRQIFDLVEMHRVKSANEENELVFYSDKSVNSVAVMLSCIMQKKTFIPVSREQPTERLNSILKSLNHRKIYQPTTTSFVEFPIDDSTTEVLSRHQSKESALYILFTSGSTGIPKGVKISESNIINSLEWGEKTFFWSPDDVIGIVTAFHFDISLFDLFTGLTKGIRLHICGDVSNPKKVCQEISEYRVTSIFSTPSIFGLIAKLDDPSLINKTRLRRIISGGDFFPPSDVIYWYSNFQNIEVFNVWGPTETSIVNSAHKVTSEDIVRLKVNKPISIGKSTVEMKIVLCEPDIKEVKLIKNDFEIGELLVQGKSVGMGYVNQDDLTQKSFITLFDERTYRTGDLGFTENGKIFMTSRDAHLIKYQGFRIDPREVETHIAKLNFVKNSCLILANRNTGNSELVLIVEQLPNFQLSISEIKIYLRNRVPAYMIPKKIVFFKEIPFNINGKLDRKSCQAIYSAEYQK